MRPKNSCEISIDDLSPIKFQHGSFDYEKEGKKLTFSSPYPSGGGCYLVTLNDTIKYVGETVDFKRRIRNFLTPGNRKTAKRVHENMVMSLYETFLGFT
ncbi:MAG: GIY-YIG nuclease family protein [Candidatus Bathyarchaeota archaeon]